MNSAIRMRQRRNSIGILFLVLFIGIAGRLIYIQGVQGSELASEARQNRLRTYTIAAPRGDIIDIDGEILATSTVRYHIAVNQQKVAGFILKNDDGAVIDTGASAASDLLAPILEMDPAELGAQMVGDSTWVYLKKGVEPTVWRQIRALGIPGIEPERVTDRLYPNGTTAGNLIGYLGTDGTPLAGVEYRFNDVLTGTEGSETVEVGAGGQVIPTGTNDTVESVAGGTVQLTINQDIQFVAQQAADQATSQYGAQWTGIAVQDLTTGGLVVLAESGMVDPGNPTDTPAAARNTARSVSSPYEPGSTGKLVTISAAINEGLVDPLSTFEVSTPQTIDGQTFKDPVPHPTQTMTTAGILAESSNVGTVQIGNLMSDAERYEYIRTFGFGSTTGIELAGESAGILYDWDRWDGRTRMATMFGQGYAVTLVQNVAMVAAIGNGGVYQSPFIVERIIAADGSVSVPDRVESHRVISEEASQTMLSMMEGVVHADSTGPKAAIDGYRVAGKTGTAQTSDSSGALTQTVANFVGVVPADNPRFAVAVVVYKPQAGFYGGTIAAPLFHDVAEFALHTYGVEPSSGEAPLFPWIVSEDS